MPKREKPIHEMNLTELALEKRRLKDEMYEEEQTKLLINARIARRENDNQAAAYGDARFTNDKARAAEYKRLCDVDDELKKDKVALQKTDKIIHDLDADLSLVRDFQRILQPAAERLHREMAALYEYEKRTYAAEYEKNLRIEAADHEYGRQYDLLQEKYKLESSIIDRKVRENMK